MNLLQYFTNNCTQLVYYCTHTHIYIYIYIYIIYIYIKYVFSIFLCSGPNINGVSWGFRTGKSLLCLSMEITFQGKVMAKSK